jgi:hypothetical protein
VCINDLEEFEDSDIRNEHCFTIADDPENESEEDNDKLENDVYCMEDNNEVFFESDDEEEIERR